MSLENLKLFDLFKSLSSNELKEFKVYIKSNFVGKNEDLCRLLEFLFNKKINDWAIITKQQIFIFLYGDALIYNDLKVRHMMSSLTKVLEDFIAFNYLKNNPIVYKKILLHHYLQKGIEKPAKNVMNELQGIMNTETIHDADYYRRRYELGVNNYHFQSNNIRTEDFGYSYAIENFTVYSIIETLKSACTINTINKVMEAKIQHPLLISILDMLPGSEYLKEPLVRMYYHLYYLVEEEKEEVFAELFSDIQKHEMLFSQKDLNTVYRTLINFCIKKSNENNVYYTRKAFEIYIYTIDNGVLIEHQVINRFIFTNVISLGIKLGELEQSMQFLESCQHLIHPDYSQNTIVYNLAKIYFARLEYDQALAILWTNEFKDKIWSLNSKYLILKILFEQNDLDSFKQQFKSFKRYVKRIQNIGYHKIYFENIIQSLNILLNKRLKKKKHLEYEFSKDTSDFEWFQKMVDEFESK
ncbi:MAG TPA: hypothetical protein VLZ75_11370 [Chitinophagales bacterium]|nr:hypothetical protein [Chitinophagales bacterium]